MALSIYNNIAALNINNTMKKNSSSLSKSLKRVSSGEKITSAADDASGYAISEKMRVLIRSLDQDRANVQTGASLLRIAEGGIQSIVDELRTLKELAINSANDHNTDTDRAIIQKEFDQRRININDIVASTNYNGKLLLTGQHRRVEETGIPSGAITQPGEPTGTPTIISAVGSSGTSLATYTINSDGVYQLDSSCKNCRIVINAENVELVGSGGTNINVIVECEEDNSNLWLKDYDVFVNRAEPNRENYCGDKALVRFGKGNNNTLNIIGRNKVAVNDAGYNYDYGRNYDASKTPATINIGGGLSIWGTGSLKSVSDGSTGAVIGTDAYEESNANIVINGGTLNLEGSVAIGSGGFGSIGNIVVNGGTINGTSWGEGFIGNGNGRDMETGTGSCGHIIINGGTVRGRNVYTQFPFIGASGKGSVGDITLRGGSVHVYGSTTGWSGVLNPIIGGGPYGSTGEITTPGAFSNGGRTYDQDLPAVPMQESDLAVAPSAINPLIIHTGPKSSQSLNVYINGMYDWDMGIDKAAVTNQTKASRAISLIDKAIDYALNEITYVGSYISRLEYTENNIVTAAENTQFAESTLRDSDMAKEMTDYTKSNVLLQAAQSMLAQANQNSSSVLSLLQ